MEVGRNLINQRVHNLHFINLKNKVMKKYIFSLLVFVTNCAIAQVIIGDEVGTATDRTSVLLDFAANKGKGIILPYVKTLPSGTGLQGGTFVINATDETQVKVQFYNGSSWIDLSSGFTANIASVMSDQPVAADNPNAKVIIGSPTSSADGILVLESSTKAMILPMVNGISEIPEPAPGMMVYIKAPGAKRLAVYNGGGWTYWAP